MNCSLAIKGLANVKVLCDLREVFLRLTGMEFSFVDVKNKPVIIPQYAGDFCRKILLSKKDEVFSDLLSKMCEVAVASRKPHFYDYNKLPFAVIPLLIQDNVIGIVLMCPSQETVSAASVFEKKRIEDAAELLFIILNYIFRNEFDILVISDSDKQYTRNQDAVIKAAEYIKRNYYNKDISLQGVSAEVSLSQYYFSHVFKDEFGISFIEYLTKVRIEAAEKLLKNKRLNVNQVAYAVGYQDPNYFSKVFKKATRFSPLGYRRNLLEKGVGKQIFTD